MNTPRRPVSAAKVVSTLAFAAGVGWITPASAQWAVIDAANVTQTTITAKESIL